MLNPSVVWLEPRSSDVGATESVQKTLLEQRARGAGVLLVEGLDNVLVVGRTASCDHLMNSAFRRMKNASQSGEVVGTAAALAVRTKQTPRTL